MTLPGEWRLCWSAVSPLVYLLVAGPTRPVPLGTVIVVLRLKNPVGTGLVKVTYIQHTTIQCMGGRGGVEDLDPAMSQDIVDAVSSGLRVLLDASLTLKSRGSGGVSSIGTRHNSSNKQSEASGVIGDSRTGVLKVCRFGPTTLGVVNWSKPLRGVTLVDRAIPLFML